MNHTRKIVQRITIAYYCCVWLQTKNPHRCQSMPLFDTWHCSTEDPTTTHVQHPAVRSSRVNTCPKRKTTPKKTFRSTFCSHEIPPPRTENHTRWSVCFAPISCQRGVISCVICDMYDRCAHLLAEFSCNWSTAEKACLSARHNPIIQARYMLDVCACTLSYLVRR